MPRRNAQVSRIYAILNLLEATPQGLAVAQLLERVKERGHEASKRTIYRDLEALQAAGFPLMNTTGSYLSESRNRAVEKAELWVLQRTAKINQYLVLSPRELVGLYLARAVLAPLRDTPFFQDLELMFNKIEQKLGTKANEHLKELASEIRFEPGPRWGLGVSPDLLDTVRASCAEKQLLSCKYASVNSGSITSRTLGAHYLYFSRGGLYLVAEDLGDHKVKTFALPRMSEAELLDAPYEGHKTNPEEHFSAALGVYTQDAKPEEVVLVFSRLMSAYAKERTWHHSQRVSTADDGTIELRLTVTISPELVQWILGFGAHVSVLGPAHLQKQILAEATAIAENYRVRLQRAG